VCIEGYSKWGFSESDAYKLYSKDGEEGDSYGSSVALCGESLIVGSYEDTSRSVESGTAYVYGLSSSGGWDIQAKLRPSLGGDSDYFGWSVSCNDDTAVVGAYGDDAQYTNSGAVYMYSKTDGVWDEYGIFYSDGPSKNEHFGWSVVLKDQLLAVGAVGNSDLYTQCGVVYTYRVDEGAASRSLGISAAGDDDYTPPVPDGWVLDSVLFPEDPLPYLNFGWSIDIHMSRLVVGAPWANSRTGVVYIYARNVTEQGFYDDVYYGLEAGTMYELVSRLEPPDMQTTTYFGHSVAVWGSEVVVGQYLMTRYIEQEGEGNVVEVQSGGAHVYRLGYAPIEGGGNYAEWWGRVVELGTLAEVEQFGMFGYSVRINHGNIVVGAPGDGVLGVNASVYLFSSSGDGWTHSGHWSNQFLDPGTSSSADNKYSRVGVSVAIRAGHFVVGDTNGINSGERRTGCAYIWTGNDISLQGKHDAHSEPNHAKYAWLVLLCVPLVIYSAYVVYLKRKEGPVLDKEPLSAMSLSASHDNSNSTSFVPDWIQPVSFHSIMEWAKNDKAPIRLVGDSSHSVASDTSYDQSANAGSSRRSIFSKFFSFGGLKRTPDTNSSEPTSVQRQKKIDLRRMMATAQAIADDDSHPNQHEVLELLHTYERDWISEDKFISEMQLLLY